MAADSRPSAALRAFVEAQTAYRAAYQDLEGNVLTPGLKWVNCGYNKPLHGVEIKSLELATALQTRTEFSEAELDSFKLPPITYQSCIKVGVKYFKPGVLKKRDKDTVRPRWYCPRNLCQHVDFECQSPFAEILSQICLSRVISVRRMLRVSSSASLRIQQPHGKSPQQ